MPVALTARERTHLKGRAHPLEPIVQIGHGGLSEPVVAELERALNAHGLIKVRINGDDRVARAVVIEGIVARTDAAIVHKVGKIVVLWRPTPEEQAPGSGL